MTDILAATVAGVVVVLTLVALYEYYAVYRPRLRKAAADIEKVASSGSEVAEDVRKVSAAVSRRLITWMEGRATKAEQRLRHLEIAIAQVQATQALEAVRSHARALETLRRFQVTRDTVLLAEARSHLRNGFADLRLYLLATGGEVLLQHHAISMLIGAYAAEAAELEELVLLASEAGGELELARRTHRECGLLWRDKLTDLGDLSRVLLPPAVRQGCGGKPGQALREQLDAAAQLGNAALPADDLPSCRWASSAEA